MTVNTQKGNPHEQYCGSLQVVVGCLFHLNILTSVVDKLSTTHFFLHNFIYTTVKLAYEPAYEKLFVYAKPYV